MTLTGHTAATDSMCITRNVWEGVASNFIQPIRLQLNEEKCKNLKALEEVLAGETATVGCCHPLPATKFKCCCSHLQSYMCLLLESKHYPINPTFMCQKSPWPTAQPQTGKKARGQSVAECKQCGKGRERYSNFWIKKKGWSKSRVVQHTRKTGNIRLFLFLGQ